MNSPFKFLRPFELRDRKAFFGRDAEIKMLYKMIFQSDLLVVYGLSGTGKSSLVQCGLAGKFHEAGWLNIFIRRRKNINASMKMALMGKAMSPIDRKASIPEILESILLDYLKPSYIVFDQLEELLISGSEKEQREFFNIIKEILDRKLSCKIVFVLREEYIGKLQTFQKIVPNIFAKRFRVDIMSFAVIHEVIKKTCDFYDIEVIDEEDTITQIIENITVKNSGMQLAYLQIYLDKLYNLASRKKSVLVS